MKKLIALVLATVCLVTCMGMASAMTVLSSQNLSVDGMPVNCEKYNVDGSNYFKLRDIAFVLNGTKAQFAVGWDAASQTISILTGEKYTPNGTELDLSGGDNSATAKLSSQTLKIDGKAVTGLSVYNIGGNNYFKLRDLGDALGFAVGYDADTRTATVLSYADAGADRQTYSVWINRDWLTCLGLPAPRTIYDVYDVLVAFRDLDPDGSGTRNEIPMCGTQNAVISYIVNAFVCYDSNGHFPIVEQKVQSPYTTKEFRQALMFMNQLVEEGLLSGMTFMLGDKGIEELGRNGVVGIFANSNQLTGNTKFYQQQALKDATGLGGYDAMDFRVTKTSLSDTCLEYVNKMIVAFCSGELNPYNSNDWQTYLNGLNSRGYSELLQTAKQELW